MLLVSDSIIFIPYGQGVGGYISLFLFMYKFLWLLLIVVLWGGHLFLTNSVATKGQELRSLRNRISELQEINADLEQEISRHTSLNAISVKAEEMGFSVPEEQVVVTAPPKVAWGI